MGPVGGLLAVSSWHCGSGFSNPQRCSTRPLGTLRGLTIVRVNPQEAGLPDQRAVWRAEGQDEVKALGRGSVGFGTADLGRCWVLRGPCPFSRPE